MGFSREQVETWMRRSAAVAPAHSKYNVAPKEDRTVNGITFDSKKEMRHYQSLLMNPAVKFFLRQVPFHLPGGVIYRADFLVFWKDGSEPTVEDVKGFKTKEYLTKKRIVEAMYPVKIKEI